MFNVIFCQARPKHLADHLEIDFLFDFFYIFVAPDPDFGLKCTVLVFEAKSARYRVYSPFEYRNGAVFLYDFYSNHFESLIPIQFRESFQKKSEIFLILDDVFKINLKLKLYL